MMARGYMTPKWLVALHERLQETTPEAVERLRAILGMTTPGDPKPDD